MEWKQHSNKVLSRIKKQCYRKIYCTAVLLYLRFQAILVLGKKFWEVLNVTYSNIFEEYTLGPQQIFFFLDKNVDSVPFIQFFVYCRPLISTNFIPQYIFRYHC